MFIFRRAKPLVKWHGTGEKRFRISEIGNTPMIEIRYKGIAPIFAKAEFINPTYSHKDRANLVMVEELGINYKSNKIVGRMIAPIKIERSTSNLRVKNPNKVPNANITNPQNPLIIITNANK